MWKLLGCLISLTLVSGGLAAVGDVILSGTIMLKGGTMCVQADGNSVTDDSCVKVVVVETDTAGEYKVQKLDGTRADNAWTIPTDAANSFTTGGGSTVVFSDGTNNLQTLAVITDSNAPFIIRLQAEANDACLKADGTYTTTACVADTDLFYFALEECGVDYCMTCNADALVVVCTTCTTDATGDGTASCTCDENTIANSVNGTCDACSTIHAECTACDDDPATICTDCTGDYVPDAADGCKTCDDDETLKSDGSVCLEHTCEVDNCQYCDDVAATCTQCMTGYSLADNACTACEDNEIVLGGACTACAEGETPNTDRDECLASCGDNCKFCDDATTCGECTDGYSVTDGDCTEDTEEENSSTHALPYLSLLSMAVLGVLFSK